MIWFKRGAIAIAALAVIAILAFNIFKKPIANAIFDRVVAERVGVDVSADLPDGLHVYICGAGAPMPDATRAGFSFVTPDESTTVYHNQQRTAAVTQGFSECRSATISAVRSHRLMTRPPNTVYFEFRSLGKTLYTLWSMAEIDGALLMLGSFSVPGPQACA